MTTVAPHMEEFLRPTRWSVVCHGEEVDGGRTVCTYGVVDSSLLWAVREARGHLTRTGHTRLVLDVAETEDVALPDG